MPEGDSVVRLAPRRSTDRVGSETSMIRLHNVSLSYRRDESILQDVSLEIVAGLTLLLGPNGSGKSTLLKMIAGIERPDFGRVELRGIDVWKDEVAARSSLAYVPEQPDLTPYATIRDVIDLVCRLTWPAVGRGNTRIGARRSRSDARSIDSRALNGTTAAGGPCRCVDWIATHRCTGRAARGYGSDDPRRDSWMGRQAP